MNKYDHIEGEACSDCLMLIANDDTSGTLRCETEEGEAAYLQDVADRTPEGSHGWIVQDGEGSFSWSSCDVCGSSLGGDRYPVVALIPAS